jgi:hypothetical protein
MEGQGGGEAQGVADPKKWEKIFFMYAEQLLIFFPLQKVET